MAIKWLNRSEGDAADLAPQNPHKTCENDLCWQQGTFRCETCKEQNEAFGHFCSEVCLSGHVH